MDGDPKPLSLDSSVAEEHPIREPVLVPKPSPDGANRVILGVVKVPDESGALGVSGVLRAWRPALLCSNRYRALRTDGRSGGGGNSISVSRTVWQNADMKRKTARVSWHSRMLSQLLGQLRAHAALSPKELATRAGISAHTIATCERYCGNLSLGKIFKYIRGVGFDHLTVFYEVSERLDLAGKPFIPGKKNPRPSVFFKPLYDEGLLDRQEVNRQLRIMRRLRKPSAQSH